MDTRDFRVVTSGAVEVRDVAGRGKVAFGRAIVYDQWSEVLHGTFRERIRPGAFDRHLDSSPDVICTVDHDEKRTLGRTSSGTTRLTRAADGIDVEVDVPDTTFGRDLAVQVGRRDFRGMSFVFEVDRDSWQQGEDAQMRSVEEGRLFEVSFVLFPAYPQTEAAIRSLTAWRAAARLNRQRLDLAEACIALRANPEGINQYTAAAGAAAQATDKAKASTAKAKTEQTTASHVQAFKDNKAAANAQAVALKHAPGGAEHDAHRLAMNQHILQADKHYKAHLGR